MDEQYEPFEEEREDTDYDNNQGGQSYAIPVAIVIAGLIVGAAIMFSGGFGVGGASSSDGDRPQAAVGTVGADDDPFLGDEDAPVELIEFSDYQCPFCRQFWRDTLSQIREEFIDTGKVRFVYRDFPLASIHPTATMAAEAAECAGDQGYYWQAHDSIFAGQDRQGAGTISFGAEDVYQWLGEVGGLNVAAVRSCVESGEKSAEVQNDFQQGRQVGINGTPSFLLNGRLFSGALPFDVFKQAIEAELLKADQ